MRNIKKMLREHRKAAVIAALVLILFTAGSVVNAVHVAHDRTQSSSAQSQEETPNKDSKTSEQNDKDDTKLTEAQRKAAAAYDDDTKTLIATLKASVWSANGGKDTLRFSGTSYTENAGGKSESHTYAVTRADAESDTSGAQTTTIVFLTDDGTHIATLRTQTGTGADDGKAITSTLSSKSMFTLKDSPYERADAAKAISVTGLNEDMTRLMGGDKNALTDALSRWCATNYPTATEASWDETAVIDYKEGIVSTNFTLNTENTVTIAATYRTATGTFEFNY